MGIPGCFIDDKMLICAMIRKPKLTIFLLLLLSGISARGEVYANMSADIYSSYVFRGLIPAGRQAAAALNASAYFPAAHINISQWYVNSLRQPADYHESGTMFSYYHYFGERFVASGNMTAYLYPAVPGMPFLTLEFGLAFSDLVSIIPYYIETYFDVMLKSWYWKFTGGYNFDLFLPVNLALSAGVNLLSYTRADRVIDRGFSDFSAQLSTYISLKNWRITPKIQYIIPLDPSVNGSMLLQAAVNIGYSF